jgi:hypothetical protein
MNVPKKLPVWMDGIQNFTIFIQKTVNKIVNTSQFKGDERVSDFGGNAEKRHIGCSIPVSPRHCRGLLLPHFLYAS